ncbi:MAG: hypothetical protein K0S71_2828 [Clostridia bacterium]|jgi:sugar lactone lactonase YvrE|nr:hypothetical protein [Clostridia bacterium]
MMKCNAKKISFMISLLVFSNLLFAKDVGIYIPYGLSDAKDGGIYIADTYSNRILKMQNENVDIVAGVSSATGNYKDGDVLEAGFNQPLDITMNSKGELFITDSENHAIRKIAGGKVTTLAGNGMPDYQDGYAAKSKFNLPSGIAIDSQDNLYVADTLNHVIRKISTDGKVSTLVGKPGSNGYADGAMGNALFNEPTDIVITKQGVIYVADGGNHVIRKIAGGKVTTVSGTSRESLEDNTYRIGGYTDGKNAQFNFPKSLIVLDSGDILVADMMNNAVRKIKSSGEGVTLLNMDNDLEAPVSLLYKNNKLYVSEKWKAGLKEFVTEKEKVVKSSVSHAKWLEITPYAPPAQTIQIWFEGNKVSSSNAGAQVVGKDVYLPVRTLAQAVGAQLKWDAKLKATEITLNAHTATIPPKSSKTKFTGATLLGEIKYLETMLGIKIDWVEQYRAIVITRS